jgi:hypothetical protein
MAIAGKNTAFKNTDLVTKETLMQFENSLVVSSKIDWSWGDLIGKPASKIGDHVSVRLPFANTVRRNSMTYNAATVVDRVVVLVVDQVFGQDLTISDADYTLSVEDFYNRYMKTGMSYMVNEFDAYVYKTIVDGTANTVGQYSVALTSDTILAAKELLQNNACPEDGQIYGILTPSLNRKLSNYQSTIFNSAKAIGKIYETGRIGEFAGVDWAISQTAPTHTDGTWTGVASTTVTLTSGTDWAETTTISVGGFTAGATLNVGDVFTLSGVYSVNPLTKATLPSLKQFVVKTAVTSATASAQAVVFAPALVAAGAFQNVSLTSTASKLIAYSTSGTQGQEGVVFAKTAVGGASPKLKVPEGTDKASAANDPDTGLSIRYVSDFASTSGEFINRVDAFAGVKVLNSDFVVRIRG